MVKGLLMIIENHTMAANSELIKMRSLLTIHFENMKRSFRAKMVNTTTDPQGITKPFFSSLKFKNPMSIIEQMLAKNIDFACTTEKKIHGKKAAIKWLCERCQNFLNFPHIGVFNFIGSHPSERLDLSSFRCS
jgi:hypothetical protein